MTALAAAPVLSVPDLSRPIRVDLVTQTAGARAHAARVREQLDRARLRASDRRVLERVAPELWNSALPVSMLGPSTPVPAPLRPYSRQPVAVRRRPWVSTFDGWWLVYDQHGARPRFVCATFPVACGVARALADEAREDHATWTD